MIFDVRQQLKRDGDKLQYKITSGIPALDWLSIPDVGFIGIVAA